MAKRVKSVVITECREMALCLTAMAAQFAEKVYVIAIDAPEAMVNAEKAWQISSAGLGFPAAVANVEKIIEEIEPDLVITEAGRNGRMIAAHCAAKLNTSAITDVSEAWCEGETILARRMVYGGGAYKTVSTEGPAVLSVGAGVFEAQQEVACAEVEEISASLPSGIEFVSRDEKRVQKVSLSAAKRVLGLGRGIKNEENLRKAEKFAELIGAELGCTRPVAEEECLMARERYIGVSGAMIKPTLYIAAGISGQVQHMVGVESSGTIIAINKDKQAAIFDKCDYGIVGEITEVIDALEKALS